MSYVYGPVLSRRLGRSLGVDPVPLKTCNLNCVYCQLGRTPSRRGTSPVHPPLSDILWELGDALSTVRELDYVTVSGSGEPTLYAGIGHLIRAIKAMTEVPVAVVTNGTLFSSQVLREALYQADVVLPSLDAAENRAFNRIARPPGGLDVEEVIAGLTVFRRHFTGQMWLEIMLVRGMNDTPEQLDCLKAAIEVIEPDRVQLNTVVRPPAVEWAQAVSPDRLAEIASYLGPRCEVIAEPPERRPKEQGTMTVELIREAVKRRPMTLYDLAEALGALPSEVAPCVARLMASGDVQSKLHQGRLFYFALR